MRIVGSKEMLASGNKYAARGIEHKSRGKLNDIISLMNTKESCFSRPVFWTDGRMKREQ